MGLKSSSSRFSWPSTSSLIRGAAIAGISTGTTLIAHNRSERVIAPVNRRVKAMMAEPFATTPVSDFNRGQVIQLFSYLPELRIDSPAAALAVTNFFSRIESDHRGLAYTQLTALLQTISANPAAAISARRNARAAKMHEDDRLSTRLSVIENAYIERLQGVVRGRGTKAQLVSRLEKTIDRLDQNDTHRLGSARIIYADFLLTQGKVTEAFAEMRKALELVGEFPSRAERFGLEETNRTPQHQDQDH